MTFWGWKDIVQFTKICILAKDARSSCQVHKGCSLCCTSKPSNRKLGLYQPLLVPSRLWECISMDFVGGLPMTKKDHDYLFVIMDRFSKMCVLIPCKKTITGQDTTNLFFSHVWVHFGLPNSIIFDRDSKFLGKF